MGYYNGTEQHGPAELIRGSFQETTEKNYHAYGDLSAAPNGEYLKAAGCINVIYNIAGFAGVKLLKTVAYILVDEDEYGLPVFEKWKITKKTEKPFTPQH